VVTLAVVAAATPVAEAVVVPTVAAVATDTSNLRLSLSHNLA
jgi:hypothetical protein